MYGVMVTTGSPHRRAQSRLDDGKDIMVVFQLVLLWMAETVMTWAGYEHIVWNWFTHALGVGI